MRETKSTLQRPVFNITVGPCMTSPYQMELAHSATNRRCSSGTDEESAGRERFCCFNKRWMADRDTVPRDTIPELSSNCLSCRIERRGFSRLAAISAT